MGSQTPNFYGITDFQNPSTVQDGRSQGQGHLALSQGAGMQDMDTTSQHDGKRSQFVIPCDTKLPAAASQGRTAATAASPQENTFCYISYSFFSGI